MQKYVISISRQFEVWEDRLQKKLAELLEIEYYDRDIVGEASKVHNIPLKEGSKSGGVGKVSVHEFPTRQRNHGDGGCPVYRRRAR